MGSHGRTGLKTLLMGSVTERVMGYALRAMLCVGGPRLKLTREKVIRNGQKKEDPREI